MSAPHAFGKLALPVGSLILVTGGSGYIGSHVVDQLLSLGFKVRGTTRSNKPWLTDLFSKRHGEGKFELVVVNDLGDPTACETVMQGVKGVILVAADTSLSSDAMTVIASAIEGTVNVLKAAADSGSVERVVYTSSSSAVSFPKPAESKIVITEDTWNEEAIAAAWAPPPHSPAQGFLVYAASKTEAERVAWKFAKTTNPPFVFNSVVIPMNLGTILDPKNIPGSTGGWVRDVYTKGDVTMFNTIPPNYMIDVIDSARLHVVGLLHPEVKSERIWGYAHKYTRTSLLETLKQLKPNNRWPKAPENEGTENNEVPGSVRAEKLLQEFFGVKGWKTPEESLKELFADLL